MPTSPPSHTQRKGWALLLVVTILFLVSGTQAIKFPFDPKVHASAAKDYVFNIGMPNIMTDTTRFRKVFDKVASQSTAWISSSKDAVVNTMRPLAPLSSFKTQVEHASSSSLQSPTPPASSLSVPGSSSPATLFTSVKTQLSHSLDKLKFLTPKNSAVNPNLAKVKVFIRSLSKNWKNGAHALSSVGCLYETWSLVAYFHEFVALRNFVESDGVRTKKQFEDSIDQIQGRSEELVHILTNIPRQQHNGETFRNATKYFRHTLSSLRTDMNNLNDDMTLYIEEMVHKSALIGKRRDNFKWGGIRSAVFAVASFPSGGFLPAVNSVVSGANLLLSKVTSNLHEKSHHRVNQFQEISKVLDNQRESLFELEHTIKQSFELYEQKEEEYQRNKSILDSFQMGSVLARTGVLCIGLFWIGMVSYVVFTKFKSVSHIRVDSSSASLTFLSWTCVCMLLCFLVVFVGDVHYHIQRKISTQQTVHLNKAKIQIQHAKVKLEKECIWNEIPVARQLFLQGKAYVSSLLLQDDLRSLTVDDTGFMISNSRCKEYQEIADLEPEFMINHIDIVTKAYTEVLIGLAKRFGEGMGSFIQQFFSALSWKEKALIGGAILGGWFLSPGSMIMSLVGLVSGLCVSCMAFFSDTIRSILPTTWIRKSIYEEGTVNDISVSEEKKAAAAISTNAVSTDKVTKETPKEGPSA